MAVLYNINVKIIGDTWEQQDLHDTIIGNFKFQLKGLIANYPMHILAGSDLNFSYDVETRKFKILSLPERRKGQLERCFELNSCFRKLYF